MCKQIIVIAQSCAIMIIQMADAVAGISVCRETF